MFLTAVLIKYFCRIQNWNSSLNAIKNFSSFIWTLLVCSPILAELGMCCGRGCQPQAVSQSWCTCLRAAILDRHIERGLGILFDSEGAPACYVANRSTRFQWGSKTPCCWALEVWSSPCVIGIWDGVFKNDTVAESVVPLGPIEILKH